MVSLLSKGNGLLQKENISPLTQHIHIEGDGNIVKPLVHSIDESVNSQITKFTLPDKVINKTVIIKTIAKIIIGVAIMIIGTLILKHYHII